MGNTREGAVAAIVDALAASTLTYSDEVSLHEDISRVLTAAGIEHTREVRLDGASRIDFTTHDGVGIEVKVAGSAAAVTRQMLRYSHHRELRALVLVTTQASHAVVPRVMNGKPVGVYSLIGQGL